MRRLRVTAASNKKALPLLIGAVFALCLHGYHRFHQLAISVGDLSQDRLDGGWKVLEEKIRLPTPDAALSSSSTKNDQKDTMDLPTRLHRTTAYSRRKGKRRTTGDAFFVPGEKPGTGRGRLGNYAARAQKGTERDTTGHVSTLRTGNRGRIQKIVRGLTNTDANNNSGKTDVSPTNTQSRQSIHPTSPITDPHHHAIIIPYRDRAFHLAEFEKYMTKYLAKYFPDDSFDLWIVEQDDTELFNRAWLANVALQQIIQKSPQTHCVILHDVDLVPDNDNSTNQIVAIDDADDNVPPVPYTSCDFPMQLGSELQHFNFSNPYATYCGGITSMTLQHWQTINGLSNDYVGWGGEDDDLYHRLRQTGLLLEPSKQLNTTDEVYRIEYDPDYWYAPVPYRPPLGRGRFKTISQNPEHHTQDKNHTVLNTAWGKLQYMWYNSPRWQYDGINDVYYTVTGREETVKNAASREKGFHQRNHWKVIPQKSVSAQTSTTRGVPSRNDDPATYPKIEMVPIPYMGGIDRYLTNAAANASIVWGACHYMVTHNDTSIDNRPGDSPFYKCPASIGSGDFRYRATLLQGITYQKASTEPWYISPNHFAETPLEGTKRFAIVQHPYNRAIDYYRHLYDLEHASLVRRRNSTDTDTVNGVNSMGIDVVMTKDIEYLTKREDPSKLNSFLQDVFRNALTIDEEAASGTANADLPPQLLHMVTNKTGIYKRYVQHIVRLEKLEMEWDKLVKKYPTLEQLNIELVLKQTQADKVDAMHINFLDEESLTNETVALLNQQFDIDFKNFKYPKRDVKSSELKVANHAAETKANDARIARLARANPQRPVPIEFSAIPFNGADKIIRAASRAGIVWSACHFEPFEDLECPEKSGDLAHGPAIILTSIHQAQQVWNRPPACLKPMPFGATFAVVRNPYDRAIDFYRNHYNRQHGGTIDTSSPSFHDREDPEKLNKFLQNWLVRTHHPNLPNGVDLPRQSLWGRRKAIKFVKYESLLEDMKVLMSKYRLSSVYDELAAMTAKEVEAEEERKNEWLDAELSPLTAQLSWAEEQKAHQGLTISSLDTTTITMLNRHFARDFAKWYPNEKIPDSITSFPYWNTIQVIPKQVYKTSNYASSTVAKVKKTNSTKAPEVASTPTVNRIDVEWKEKPGRAAKSSPSQYYQRKIREIANKFRRDHSSPLR